MVRAAHVCAALLLLACIPQSAAAKWTTLQSPNFLFVGDAPEGQIRRVAQQLEQFRDVVGQIVPSTRTSSVPTTVVVFANERSLRPYTPQFQGRSVDVAGYFAGNGDVAYIALNAEQEEIAFTTIFHEYAHFITASSGARLPPWASEGLAQVWETFRERDGGRAAVIGLAAAHQVELLRGSTLIPLRDLRAVTHESPLYNEGTRRSVFYAQSWALMHYMMLGNPARTSQLRVFLNAVRTGAAPEQAFAAAFGDDRVLEQELFQYVRNFTFPAVKYDLDQRIGGAVGARGAVLADVEAAGYLGGLLVALRRVDDARALLTATLKAAPQAVRPAVALALLDLEDDRLEDAVARLERVVERTPDDGAALEALGHALFEQYQALGSDDAAARAKAHTVLSRAAAAERAGAHALAMLASLELDFGGNDDRAVSLLEQAVKKAPDREQYRLMIAQALMRQRQFERATSYLGPLVAAGGTAAVRDSARRLLGEAADVRARMAGQQSGGSAETNGGRSGEAATAPSVAASAPARPSGSAPRYILDLRPVGSGETRVSGVFRGIECESKAVILLVDVNGAVLRIAAERLDRIDFISYRPEQPGAVSCGAVPPVRVLATYRADTKVTANSAGVAVALELLPDGYTMP
jgi:tetratricopeptide (TPR) repeat protein